VSAWPDLTSDDWPATSATFIRWTQVVGKVRMERTPVLSHWWNVPLYVSARGLTTSLMPADERGFEVGFDLIDHRLDISVTDGSRRSMGLEPMSVAEFHRRFHELLGELDLATPTWDMPVEIPAAVPFSEDTANASYDADAVHRHWLAMVQMQRVFEVYRAEFVGKSSPVHLFWGALDLAITRFSGRDAPPHPGGAPNCGPHVMHEAYSHEVASAGYWPDFGAEGAFYAYAYPEPDGYRTTTVEPDAARWDDGLSEFVLPYEVVRTSDDPDGVLLAFLRSTYAAAADRAGWDRPALERSRPPVIDT